jgi:alanine racemase
MNEAAASVLEIDLAAITTNWRTLDARHAGATAGVIKADAYGLSAARVAPTLLAAGCKHFFVAHLGEALAVRELLPSAMLAVLNGILPGEAAAFAARDIVPVLGSLPEIALWRGHAAALGRRLPAIVHVDTGMNRLGLPMLEVAHGLTLDGLDVLYVMTHLVSADRPDDAINQLQAERFTAVRAEFPAGQKYSFANSSGAFLGALFQSDLARPGAALYGVNPTPGQANPMRPVVRLAARILQARDVKAGETVGYEGFWTAGRDSRIATVAVGYADGYLRALSNAGSARFDGKVVPLVGRVSMDLTTFDVTDTGAEVGDYLQLIGPGHDVDALAAEAGTNGYEILTSLGGRYQRRYQG